MATAGTTFRVADIAGTTFRVADAVAVYNAIQNLKNVRVAISVAARILALERWARPHAAHFMDSREKIAAKLGTKQGELQWSIASADLAEFTSMVTELGLAEVDPPPAIQIDLASLGEAMLTAGDLASLAPFLSNG